MRRGSGHSTHNEGATSRRSTRISWIAPIDRPFAWPDGQISTTITHHDLARHGR